MEERNNTAIVSATNSGKGLHGVPRLPGKRRAVWMEAAKEDWTGLKWLSDVMVQEAARTSSKRLIVYNSEPKSKTPIHAHILPGITWRVLGDPRRAR